MDVHHIEGVGAVPEARACCRPLLDTAARVRILRRNFDSSSFLGCLQALASNDLFVCQRSCSATHTAGAWRDPGLGGAVRSRCCLGMAKIQPLRRTAKLQIEISRL
jgi:hypothetical protein